ncbi:hypothetical protein [Flagellimonas nanhaiensis]|uniref:Lipocalin-like domain-containing protein n=1 Tax=Flagellimonas nanhaiensis TaxID=2292706 RepID=A0A371JUT7_9FLAO|nr:hypothetical protein [Allomuricauda nanhaiensis]RDY61578.1 hypothetical protein DX873_05310 [Allomuricauda nanhaiensis]
MKNLRNIFLLTALLSLAVSCSDDDGGNAQNVNLDVAGIWDLTEVNVSSAQDVDMDGTSSANLVDEVDCISGTLLIDGDLSYSYEQTTITVTELTNGQFIAQCSGSTSVSGTWTANNAQVVFSGSSVLGTFSILNGTLVNDVGEDLPGIQSFVYTKRP